MAFSHHEEHRDEGMMMIQANIDDMNPEFCSYVSDKLFERGANDVYWIPIIMKKGRPGIMLNVLTDESLLPAMEEVIFRETTTLGVRYMRASCHRLGRTFEQVETAWGTFTVKAGYYQGELVQYAPEFGECQEAAKRYGLPLKAIYDEIRKAYLGKKQAPGSE